MKFITFEGSEGSGKSTQSKLLYDYLTGIGYKVKLTREPGGTWIGEAIRKILLDPNGSALVPETELLLYLGVRALHVRTVIEPALKANMVVICDRFIDATVAYQGYGSGLDLDLIHRMNNFAIGPCRPDITFILDVDVEIGLKRAIAEKKDFAPEGMADRMEGAGLEFHRRVHNGYRSVAENDRDRVRLIPSGPVDSIFHTIKGEVDKILPERRIGG